MIKGTVSSLVNADAVLSIHLQIFEDRSLYGLLRQAAQDNGCISTITTHIFDMDIPKDRRSLRC